MKFIAKYYQKELEIINSCNTAINSINPRGKKHLAGENMHYVSPLHLMNKRSFWSYVIIYQGSPQHSLNTSQTPEESWGRASWGLVELKSRRRHGLRNVCLP